MGGDFREFDTVRVTRLPSAADALWEMSIREPRLGETGAIVYIGHDRAGVPRFTVENVAEDGFTLWMADFQADQIELESRPSPSATQ